MNDFTKQELSSILEELEYALFSRYYREDMVIIRSKIKYMIDNYCEPNINDGHMTDKHIDQWAGYLLEELPNYEKLIQNDGLAKIFTEMYKKGFQDCKTVGGTQCHDNQ